MIRLVASVAVLIVSGSSAIAEDVLLKGGRSPDGNYEVRMFQANNRDPSDYFCALVNAKNGQVIKELGGSGFAKYAFAKETAFVFWHQSSRFFAMTDRGTRHSMELYVYEVQSNDVVLIRTPDYFQNALGRVDATEGYLVSVVKPLRWDGDLLICSLIFDTYLPNHGGRSPQYRTEFTLELFHGANSESYFHFVSMKKPEPEEG